MNNFAKRVSVAVLAIPIVLWVSYAGGVPFLLFVLLVSTVMLREFYQLAVMKGSSPNKPLGYTAGVMVCLSYFHPQLRTVVAHLSSSVGVELPFPSQSQLILIGVVIIILVTISWELFRGRPGPMGNISTTLLGIMYVPFLLGTLVGLRELFNPFDVPVYRYFPGVSLWDAEVAQTLWSWGGLTVISVFVSIWLCDTAAYQIGTPFGRHKLFPRVSPKKSVEGAIAGVVAALLSMIIMRWLFLPYLSLVDALVLGTVVGVLGQIGDLAESWFKRDAGVKDSSSLLPGHGGALDRFDSLLFVAPVVYLYIDFIIFT